MTKKVATKQNQHKGQSLVEVALFFPILVILLAGIVELSQLVITQNRVSNAARTAARFGANGGEDDGVTLVALNTITQTLEVAPEKWDIWVVRGQFNPGGDAIEEFTFEHTYGISNTQLISTVVPDNIKEDIRVELQTDENGATIDPLELANELGEVRFIGTYILHDVDSIIGLDAFPALARFSSVRALTVMRVTGLNIEQTRGCDAFPIGVDEVNFRSVSAPGGTGAYVYPDTADFAYPLPAPTYNYFVNHRDDRPIRDAFEGYLFKLDANTMRWLVWNTINVPNDSSTLEHSLDWPGDSKEYDTWGYYEPGDPSDKTLNIGDYVAISSGTMGDISNVLEEHVDRERTLRVVLYDSIENGVNVHISGFAVFRIVGFNPAQNWLLVEFIRLDESCGQEIQDSP